MSRLTLITSMASRELLQELAARFTARAPQPVDVEAAGGVEVAKRVRSGAAVDVVVLARNTIDDLAREGALIAQSITPIAQSGIAVAVGGTATAPDISSEQAVRRAVVTAPSICYSTGPSGVYLEKKFAAWGVLDEIRARIVVAPPGVPVGTLVAAGQVALGFQQLSELINVDGIKVVGPLPEEMQLLTTFSGAVTRVSEHADLARELLQFLSSREAAAVKPRFGMQHCLANER
jgi:molybdate transport system substrate-binding protein